MMQQAEQAHTLKDEYKVLLQPEEFCWADEEFPDDMEAGAEDAEEEYDSEAEEEYPDAEGTYNSEAESSYDSEAEGPEEQPDSKVVPNYTVLERKPVPERKFPPWFKTAAELARERPPAVICDSDRQWCDTRMHLWTGGLVS